MQTQAIDLENFKSQYTMPESFAETIASFSDCAVQESRYKYVGMNDSEVESMVIANLPESMTIENVKLYLAIHRKMHEIINTSTNMGEATAKGASKLSYMLDFIEMCPAEHMTKELLIEGSAKVEMKIAEAQSNYNTHLHDLASMSKSRNESIDSLLKYYLLTGDKLHMSKYFDMQGEAAAEGLLEELGE